MINSALLEPSVQKFIKAHEHQSAVEVILKGSPFSKVTAQELAQQIIGRQKAKKKLPLWYRTPSILFPPKLNLEQTSSELTAQFKASLIKGKSLLDMTGGFGVDSYFFSSTMKEVTYLELDPQVHAFAKANFETLGVSNCQCILTDSVTYLETSKERYDSIYVDPGRRNETKGKVFMLRDCLPNIPKYLPLILQSCNELWIKTAPILDITSGIQELKEVSEIYIIAVKNEVKELVWRVHKNVDSQEPTIHAIDLDTSVADAFTFTQSLEGNALATYSSPYQYIYEPSAAILKSGAFNLISERLEINKLAKHSHLYTSSKNITFPGRKFQLNKWSLFNKQSLKSYARSKANITTRNFPITVAALRKKFKIREGGNQYLFFTTLENGSKVVLECIKIE